MANLGYRNRTICLICGAKQPYVSKVLLGKLKVAVQPEKLMTPEQEIRYLIIKAIEDCEPIFDAEYQAVVHMKLLKYIG